MALYVWKEEGGSQDNRKADCLELPGVVHRSFWQEEVEGPWDAESRGLTPGQRNRASC